MEHYYDKIENYLKKVKIPNWAVVLARCLLLCLGVYSLPWCHEHWCGESWYPLVSVVALLLAYSVARRCLEKHVPGYWYYNSAMEGLNNGLFYGGVGLVFFGLVFILDIQSLMLIFSLGECSLAVMVLGLYLLIIGIACLVASAPIFRKTYDNPEEPSDLKSIRGGHAVLSALALAYSILGGMFQYCEEALH